MSRPRETTQDDEQDSNFRGERLRARRLLILARLVINTPVVGR